MLRKGVTQIECIIASGDDGIHVDVFQHGAISKINNKVKFLLRNTDCFNMKVKTIMTSALIQCHFDYASASWFSGLSEKKQVTISGITKQSCKISSQSDVVVPRILHQRDCMM